MDGQTYKDQDSTCLRTSLPTPLSPDVCHRFHVLYLEGHSAREIGRRLLIFAATAVCNDSEKRRSDTLKPLR